MKTLAVIFLIMLLSIAHAVRAQDGTIKLPPGSSPATVKGHVNPLSSRAYKLSVSGNQRVAIHLTSTSHKNLVRFNIQRDRFTGKPLPGAEKATDWQGVLKEGGDYWIGVFAMPDADEEDFTLVVSIPADDQASASGTPGQQRLPSAHIQDAKFDLSRIPLQGNTYRDFIPKGWEIRTAGDSVEESEEFASGDLNGDGKDDVAFILNSVNKDSDYPPTLVILLTTPSGKLRRAGVNDQLINGGSYDTFGVSTPPFLEIKKGVLSTHQQFVSNGLNDLDGFDHHFRLDAQSDRFVLIGADSEYNDRTLKHSGLRISDNYLTSERITTKMIVGKGDKGYMGNYGRMVDTRSSIPRRHVWFEDAQVESKTLDRLTGRG